MTQRIDGNGNVQAGRDVHIWVEGRPEPRNGNMMACPACGHSVSRTADYCPVCADDLAYRRQVAYQASVRRRAWKMIGFFGAVAALAYVAAHIFPGISNQANLVMGLAIAATLIPAKYL